MQGQDIVVRGAGIKRVVYEQDCNWVVENKVNYYLGSTYLNS